MSEADKFRRAQQQFVRIGGELAQFPDDRFQSAMSELDKWWYKFHQSDDPETGSCAEEPAGHDEAGQDPSVPSIPVLPLS